MDRLTARRTDNGLAYLVGVKPDEQEVDSPHPNTLKCILDCFERLAEYEDTDLEPEEIHQMRRQWRDTEKHLRDNCIHLRAELEQVKRERDAAVEDLKGMCEVLNSCAFCIHDLRGTNENWPTIHCNNKDKRKCWIWRGFKAGDRS